MAGVVRVEEAVGPSKGGIIGFTRALTLEGASRDITANVVAPGYIDTAMVATVPAAAMGDTLKPVSSTASRCPSMAYLG
ncbi:SDR family oxidoreductase [Polaromonas sp.]|uniref:SDR family oxidoreductase n=1 Tax=Polaromonas sp. TaxID=1869339 RepID=UPI003262DC14